MQAHPPLSGHDHHHDGSEQKYLCQDDSQCLNGGHCEDAHHVIGHRHCHCAQGFSGPDCGRVCPLSCQNDGYCAVAPTGGLQLSSFVSNGNSKEIYYDPDDYICKCTGHFGGTYCEKPFKPCGKLAARCFNGGYCVLDQEDLVHKCQCLTGFTGNSCSEQILQTHQVDSSNDSVEKMLVAFVLLLGLALYFLFNRKKRQNQMSYRNDTKKNAENLSEMPHTSFDSKRSIDFLKSFSDEKDDGSLEDSEIYQDYEPKDARLNSII